MSHASIRPAFLACLVAAFAAGGYWSLRLAWADWLSRSGDPAAVARAVDLSADNADFRIRLAYVLDREGDDPGPALVTASILNPRDAGVWMRLGMNAEMHGDYAAAERYLLAAVQVSRRFEPRWTLANFYFRRRDEHRFWPWIRESLLVGNNDLTPVFTLCWAMRPDAALILGQAIPDRRPVLNAYLWFLLRQRRIEGSTPVARRLAAVSTAEDRAVLVAWSDQALAWGDPAAAMEIWNALCARRILPYPPLDPGRGLLLTDGSFQTEPAGGGFGWRLEPVTGINSGRSATARYLWFSLSGIQPARCEPLSQYVPVVPGRHYRLSFRYRTSDLPKDSGLSWQVLDARSGASLVSRSPALSSPVWKDDEVLFAAPLESRLARVVFTYRQDPGALSTEGSALLSGLRLEQLP
ncbi:MAG TPA: hypothetical protein VMI94_07825 [Bryobacteraceae bacterium]|nr:hypothetical protein [Bryobacteraceae bacterium]